MADISFKSMVLIYLLILKDEKVKSFELGYI